MQEGIQRASAQFIAMPAQFLDHSQAINRLLHGMVQDVKPDEAGVQFAMIGLMRYFRALAQQIPR